MLHEQHRCVDDPGAPEVVDDLLQEIAHVRHQLAVERQAALECAVRERALAEAVDREDRREVEVRQRLLDPAGRRVAIVALPQSAPAAISSVTALPRSAASAWSSTSRMRSRSSSVAATV